MFVTIIVLGALAVLYKIYDTFKNEQSMFECYSVAYLPLVVFILLGSINPTWRGYESLGYFLIYIPMFALIILPFTMIPVIIAHIVYKLRKRNHQNLMSVKKSVKKADVVTAFLFIGGMVFMFLFWIISIIGFLLTTGVCIYKITHFIKRKVKECRT